LTATPSRASGTRCEAVAVQQARWRTLTDTVSADTVSLQ
jgi:hypothetical protein